MILVYVNKVLMEHSHAHPLCTVYSCFHTTVAELNIAEIVDTYNLKYLLCGPLQKSLLTSTLNSSNNALGYG